MGDFDATLPRILAAYHEGALVPFIGSGMSIGPCVDWRTMLNQLAEQVGRKLDDDIPSAESEGLYRVADNLTALIETKPIADREKIYRCAMSAKDPSVWKSIPEQTKELGKLYWPLVISTNYDDVYRSGIDEPLRKPNVLGRSPADCYRVLTSLDACEDPILWSIQGFVGGPNRNLSCPVPEDHQRARLVEQVVVGHRQYQRATSDAVHFRRAFAEVYRRRSLWFLGSGITESYLTSLISEIRHFHGVGRHPHFACIEDGDLNQDELRFLESRLGIVPILYPNHGCLWRLLADFAKKALDKNKFRLTASTYRLRETNVELVSSPLPHCLDSARIVSLGRSTNGEPIEGNMARSATQHQRQQRRNDQHTEWIPIDKDPPHSVFRYGNSLLFGVAARSHEGHNNDIRDLEVIPKVVKDALSRAAELAEEIHVGAIASGPARPWHPVHPFVQMLFAVRGFVANGSTAEARRIVLHVVDWRVWMALRANLVSVAEILFSNIIRYRVEVHSDRGTFDTFTMTSPCVATVQSILEGCGLEAGNWEVELVPWPSNARNAKRCTVVPPSVVLRVRHQVRGEHKNA